MKIYSTKITHFAVMYENLVTGKHEIMSDVKYKALQPQDLIEWFEAEHPHTRVICVVPHN